MQCRTIKSTGSPGGLAPKLGDGRGVANRYQPRDHRVRCGQAEGLVRAKAAVTRVGGLDGKTRYPVAYLAQT